MSKRVIPATNEIKLYFHCGTCAPDKPADVSPRDWSRVECGWTLYGFQVWCIRCDLNIAHIDFEGKKHPANLKPRMHA